MAARAVSEMAAKVIEGTQGEVSSLERVWSRDADGRERHEFGFDSATD